MEVKIKLEIFIRLYNQSLYLSLDIGQKNLPQCITLHQCQTLAKQYMCNNTYCIKQ